MAGFKVSATFSVPMYLLIPTKSVASAVTVKTYPDGTDGELIYGSFRTFGGTEREVNGLLAVENTATVVTWYRPDIKADCRIYLPETEDTYEILGTPEDIDMRHQYMTFKVRAVKGGA